MIPEVKAVIITWKWKITSKLREYEFNVPLFGLLIPWALAHSLTYTMPRSCLWDRLTASANRNHCSCIRLTNKTISRNRPSISLIQNKNFDFIWPHRLSIETSQEMFWPLLSNFKMGTLALGIYCNLRNPPADSRAQIIKIWRAYRIIPYVTLMLLLFPIWNWRMEQKLVSHSLLLMQCCPS